MSDVPQMTTRRLQYHLKRRTFGFEVKTNDIINMKRAEPPQTLNLGAISYIGKGRSPERFSAGNCM